MLFEFFFCVMQAAFYRTHGDGKLFCDLFLGKVLEEIQVQDLFFFVAQGFQGLPHGGLDSDPLSAHGQSRFGQGVQ